MSNYQKKHVSCFEMKLRSVASPVVIQENGRLSFEDDLRSEGLLYCVSQSETLGETVK